MLIIGAILTGAGIYGYGAVTDNNPPSSGGSFNATVFVAVPVAQGGLGSDTDATNCAVVASADTPPGGADHGCATFAKACSLAAGGSTIKVYGGTGTYPSPTLSYPTQTILRSNCNPTSDVTFKGETGDTVNVDAKVNLGSGTSAGLGAPSHLVFDAINITDGAFIMFPGASTDSRPSNVTYKNAHISCMNLPVTLDVTCANHLIYMKASGVNTTIQNMELGPMCCDGDLANIIPSGAAYGAERDAVFDNIYMHDNYDTCVNFPAALTAQGYSCTGTGFGDPAGGCYVPANIGCDHVDGFQLEGFTSSLTIKNSRIYALNTGRPVAQGMFGETVNCTDPCWTGTLLIQNNAISSFASCGFCFDGAGNAHYSITANVINNTFAKFRWDMDDFVNGATLNIYNNIFQSMTNSSGGSTWSCTWTPASGSMTVNMDYNLVPTGKNCGAHDVQGTPTYVGSNTGNTPDMKLSGAQSAIDGGDAAHCPATDAFGTVRPLGAGCDIGFNEAG